MPQYYFCLFLDIEIYIPVLLRNFYERPMKIKQYHQLDNGLILC